MTTTLHEAAAMLRGAAVKLEQLHKQAMQPLEGNCNLNDAIQALQMGMPAHCPKRLTLEVWIYEEGPQITWHVWDNQSGDHKAKTLEGAVNACLIAHAPAPENPVGVAQEALTPMPF